MKRDEERGWEREFLEGRLSSRGCFFG